MGYVRFALKRDAVPKTVRNDEYGKKQMHFGKVVQLMSDS